MSEHLERAAKACHHYNPWSKYLDLTWEEVPTSQRIAYEMQAKAAVEAFIGDEPVYRLDPAASHFRRNVLLESYISQGVLVVVSVDE